MLMHFILLTFIIVSSLISVAFYTLLERKILSYMQIRKGPNKVGFLGIFQPFSDAIKLFSKSLIPVESMNFFLSFMSPALIIMLTLFIWPLMPFASAGILDFNMSMLSFLILSSLLVYAILIIGWSANSKFCLLGAVRSVAQMISYEVSLFFIILSPAIMIKSFSLSLISSSQMIPLMFPMSMMFIIWMITCLAETNRAPFDFAEGESELVSGFNVEYMGGWFALIFMAEYLSMVSLSIISTILFISMVTSSIFIISISTISSLFLWVRATFPRFRYDLLMHLNWKIFLPLSISFFTAISIYSMFLI